MGSGERARRDRAVGTIGGPPGMQLAGKTGSSAGAAHVSRELRESGRFNSAKTCLGNTARTRCLSPTRRMTQPRYALSAW